MLTHFSRSIGAPVLTALMLLLSAGAIRPAAAEDTNSYSLKHALDSKFVKALICATGASSGYVLILAIKSQIDSALQITVPSGTVLENNDANAQSMVVHGVVGEYDSDVGDEIAEKCAEAAEEEERNSNNGPDLSQHWLQADTITLDPHQSGMYLLSAYCLEFEKDNPGSSDRLIAVGAASGELARLYSYLDGKLDAYDVDTIQLATWAVSGDESADHIASKYGYSADAKKNACQLLSDAGINAGGKALCSQ
jgi:hypothetical protein